MLYDNQDHYPIHAAISLVERRRTHHVAAQQVIEIYLPSDIGIG